MSVYKAQARKTPGADEIPSEVLRTEMTVVLTYFLGSSNIALMVVGYRMNGLRV